MQRIRRIPAVGLALAALALVPALPGPVAAQTFLACRFDNARLRLALEDRGLALEIPGQTLWQEADEVVSRRDPLVAVFAGTLPGEGWRRLPPYDRFTLSLDRANGTARLSLSARPPAAQVAACRAATAATAEALQAGEGSDAAEEATPTSRPPPPPCDLPVTVGGLTGLCEVQRLRF
jgi:hypothetical protein